MSKLILGDCLKIMPEISTGQIEIDENYFNIAKERIESV